MVNELITEIHHVIAIIDKIVSNQKLVELEQNISL